MEARTPEAFVGPSSKPGPLVRQEGEARLVVRSLGTAGAGLVRTLKHVLPFPETQVAALLYQAPSELVVGLPRATAEAMGRMLGETGLDVAVLEQGEPFSSGLGDCEVALRVLQVEHMGGVLREIMEVLGVDMATARRLACASPAILLGRISEATVEALRRRFARWGAELDVSRPGTACFDLYLAADNPSARALVLRVLREAGVAPAAGSERASQPLVAAGLEAATASAVWERLQRTHVPLRLLNRDFQRFDLLLEQARPGPELSDFLVQSAGIPAAVVPRLLERLPIVTHPDVPHARLAGCLEDYARRGCRVSARLVSSQSFALELTEVRDVATTLLALEAVAGLDEVRARPLLHALPARLEGPFTAVHARWLQHELKRVGTTARLVLA